jgi:hypothetical protein
MVFKKLPDNLKPFYSEFFRNKKQYHDRIISGFDSETTNDGKIILLANESESTSAYPTIDELLAFLVKKDHDSQQHLNFFFNLDFDVAAIFKSMVNQIKFETGSWKLKYGSYEIYYLEGKLLRIIHGHKISEFFDLANFLSGSLNTLSKKYLNDVKADQEIVDKSHMENIPFEVIRKYCIKDALLTAKLGKILFDMVENFSLILLGYKASPVNWFSKATLSEFYLKLLIPEKVLKPKYNKLVLEYAYKSYHGGMFENFVKGPVKCSTIDLNSAYPSQIRELIALDGEWLHVTEFKKDATYGFYKVRVIYNGFIPYELKGKVYYPKTTEKHLYYATQNELIAFKNYEVIDGWVFYPYKTEYPFKNLIDKLYNIKIQAKQNNDPNLYWLAKIILNGIYGKFVQTSGNRAGSLFNPVFGAVITANTRIKIFQSVKLFNKVYSIDTDSITGVLKNKFKNSDALGEWSLKEQNVNKTIIQNGLSLNNKNEFINTRGFSKYKVNKFQKNNLTINIEIYRPKHIRECVKQHIVNSINTFITETKVIDLNASKRIFFGKFNWGKITFSMPFGDELIVDEE